MDVKVEAGSTWSLDFIDRWRERGCEEEDDERNNKCGCVMSMELNNWVKSITDNIGCLNSEKGS